MNKDLGTTVDTAIKPEKDTSLQVLKAQVLKYLEEDTKLKRIKFERFVSTLIILDQIDSEEKLIAAAEMFKGDIPAFQAILDYINAQDTSLQDEEAKLVYSQLQGVDTSSVKPENPDLNNSNLSLNN